MGKAERDRGHGVEGQLHIDLGGPKLVIKEVSK